LRRVEGSADAILSKPRIDIVCGAGIAINAERKIAGLFHRLEEFQGHALGRALGAMQHFIVVSEA
jgi:hypothetical protein